MGRLHLLDADAVAIEAARHNVPSAKRFFLSDCWPTHSSGAICVGYDWIVSNPPLHYGKTENFRAVQALIRGAPHRLRRGGTLWIVSLAPVPVGCFLAATRGFANISTV